MGVYLMVRVMVTSLDLFKDADIEGVLRFNAWGTYHPVEL